MVVPARLLLWAAILGGNVRDGLRWASQHTGIPVILVAAVALAVFCRIFTQTLRFAIQVALAAALLLGATRLGFLNW